MAYFKMGGKAIFQDKPSPELRSLMKAIHNEEERQDWEFTCSPHGSEATMTDAEFARHLRVMVRKRKEEIEMKKAEESTKKV